MTIQTAISARADNVLNSAIRIRGVVTTWRAWVDSLVNPEISISDGMIDYNRHKFNSIMDCRKQDEYIRKLKEKTYYWVDNVKVNKTIYEYAKKRHNIA